MKYKLSILVVLVLLTPCKPCHGQSGGTSISDSDLAPCESPLAVDNSVVVGATSRMLATLGCDEAPIVKGGSPVARFLVQPTDDPEWIVTVVQPDTGPAFVELVVATKNVVEANIQWVPVKGEPKSSRMQLRPQPASVATHRYKRELPRATADKIRSTLWPVLRGAVTPDYAHSGRSMVTLHGTSYSFAVWYPGGWTCAEATSPDENDPASTLVNLLNVLAGYARAQTSTNPTTAQIEASLKLVGNPKAT